LTAEDKDTAYFLTIRAKGDFTGDGVEQIAVFASANGKHSSWSHAEYLILEPTSHGTLVRLTERRAPYTVKAINTERIIESCKFRTKQRASGISGEISDSTT
jgi:hypothetical protein